MNWTELESRFYQTFAESIDTESCIEQFGEARAFYGLTQSLARAARGKMPDKSAVNYTMGIMRRCTEKEASVAFRKRVSVPLEDVGCWGVLKETIRDLKLEGVAEIKLTYLGDEQVVPIAQIEGVMVDYANHTITPEWHYWLTIIMMHLILRHLYSPESIALAAAREFRSILPEREKEVMNYYRPERVAGAAALLAKWKEAGYITGGRIDTME